MILWVQAESNESVICKNKKEKKIWKKRKKKVQWIMLKAIKVVKLDVFTASWSHLKDKANGLLHKIKVPRNHKMCWFDSFLCLLPINFKRKEKKKMKKNMVTPSNFELQVNFSVLLLLFTVICVRKSIKTTNKMYWYGSTRWKWWQGKKDWNEKKRSKYLKINSNDAFLIELFTSNYSRTI